jgi:hypothetical protein
LVHVDFTISDGCLASMSDFAHITEVGLGRLHVV